VLCVHAVPRGQGLGAEAMNQVCTWADRNRQNLELTASSDDAARFYRRFGFATTHGRHMTRMCQVH
jgi:GNAT superfamily N-acetyltransferase